MNRKKMAASLATGCLLVSMLSAPMVCHGAEATTASEQVSKTENIAETYREQANKLFAAGKFEEAAEFCKKAAQETKNNDEDWANCGIAYVEAKKFLEAAEAFKNAAKIDKKNDLYWYHAGRSYFAVKKFKEAANCLEKAAKLKPNNGEYHYGCGMSYWERAVQSSNDAARKAGFAPVTLGSLRQKACQHLGRAAELEPNNAEIQKFAGYIIEQVAAESEASAKSPWTIVNWGAIANKYRTVYQCYCRLLDIDPNNAEYIANLSRFIQDHPKYGFQPYAGQKTPTADNGGAQATPPTTNSGSGTQAAPTITADGDWNVVQTLEDGPVQFNPRTVLSNVLEVPVLTPLIAKPAELQTYSGEGTAHMYVSGIPADGLLVSGMKGDGEVTRSLPDRKIQIDSQKPLYMIYSLAVKTSFAGTNGLQSVYERTPRYKIHAVFDYEEETNTFTIYGPDWGSLDENAYGVFNRNYHPNDRLYGDVPPNYTYVPVYSIRLIDRNTVEVESFYDYAPSPGRYEYRKYDLPRTGNSEEELELYPGYAWVHTDVAALREVMGYTPEHGYNDGSAGRDNNTMTDKDILDEQVRWSWLIAHGDGYREVGVDGLFAFLARNGNVGYAPSNVSHLIGHLPAEYEIYYYNETP